MSQLFQTLVGASSAGSVAPAQTLYVNPELAGGSDSTPPTAHTIGFGTVTYLPLILGNTYFEWDFNPELANGRAYLTYDVAANNPGLSVGSVYRYSCVVTQVAGTNYPVAITTSGDTNVTILDSSTNSIVGVEKLCHIDFRIDAPGWALGIRAGVGTTANRSDNILVKYPKLYQPGFLFTDGTEPPASVFNGIPLADDDTVALDTVSAIDHYHQGLPMTANGRLCVDIDLPVSYYGSGSAPFTANGKIAAAVGQASHYVAKVPFDSSGRIALVGGI